MVAKRVNANDKTSRRPPATTPEGRELQLTALAYDLAEKQLTDGSASAQVITHFLKAGTEKDRLEREKLRKENLLTQAKIEQLSEGSNMRALMEDAMRAFTEYRGLESLEDEQ